MHLVRRLWFVFCWFVVFHAAAQKPAEFQRLQHLGDSALKVKDYRLSIRLYEESLNFLSGIDFYERWPYYYNLAGAYSSSGNQSQAVRYLDLGFSHMRTGQGSTVSYLRQILTDPILKLILKTSAYSEFLRKNYPALDLHYQILRYDTLKEISYQDLMSLVDLLKKLDPVVIVVHDKLVYWKKTEKNYIYNDHELPLPQGKYWKTAFVIFENCTFRLRMNWNAISSYEQGNRKVQPFLYRSIFFNRCHFEGPFSFENMEFAIAPEFSKCTFDSLLYLRCFIEQDDGQFGGLKMINCSVHSTFLSFDGSVKVFHSITHTTSSDSTDFVFRAGNVSSFEFSDNQLAATNIRLGLFEAGQVTIKDNRMDRLDLIHTQITDRFIFRGNKLNQFLLYQTYFTSDPANSVDWKSVDSLRLATTLSYPDDDLTRVPEKSLQIISGSDPADLADPYRYEELIGLYSMFLNLYKNKNYQESYNRCYYSIKELQTRRLHYSYSVNKSFETYFRWRLSSLLRYYVRHGTDPARAILISVYIIACFGIFFFFFPSDWDVTSKPRLIRNFKDFIQKNEKGYFKPFLALVGGFAISLLNALTLSLNAFITLGFGNIPTHGIARYFCVLEGFLGWFLLSIFTVALLNQVLQ